MQEYDERNEYALCNFYNRCDIFNKIMYTKKVFVKECLGETLAYVYKIARV